MKIKKILTSFFLICASVLCLFGCADLEAFRIIDPYSETSIITDRFVVTLDKNKLGSSFQTVKESIYDDMVMFRNYVYDWIDSFEENHNDVYQELSKGIACEVVPSTDNLLSINLGFADEYCFALFYGVITLENEETTKAMDDIGPFLSQILKQDYEVENFGTFLYKYAIINNSNIYDQLPNFQIEDLGINYYTKYTDMTNYNIENINVSQVFVYPNDTFVYADDKIYNNADVVEVVDNFTYLYWDLNNKGEDFELFLYKLAPNTIPWYVLALIISVVVVIVAIIVIKLKSKNKIKVLITKAEAEKDER